jgi:hypothetical protein
MAMNKGTIGNLAASGGGAEETLGGAAAEVPARIVGEVAIMA